MKNCNTAVTDRFEILITLVVRGETQVRANYPKQFDKHDEHIDEGFDNLDTFV